MNEDLTDISNWSNKTATAYSLTFFEWYMDCEHWTESRRWEDGLRFLISDRLYDNEVRVVLEVSLEI